MKKILIAFALFVAIAATVGYIFRDQVIKYAAVSYITNVAQDKLTALDFPADEREEIMGSVEILTKRIQLDDFKQEDIQALLTDPVVAAPFGAVLVQGFHHKYVPQANYDEAGKAAAAKTISRFQDAILRRLIPDATYEDLAMRVVTSREDMAFKDQLTRDEVDACLRVMAEAADQAGIPDALIEIDAVDEFRRAVEQATGAAPATAPDPHKPAAPTTEPPAEQPAEQPMSL